MKLLLATALTLLFLWLHKAQTSGDPRQRDPCEAASWSQTAVSLLVSPLSLYSWFTSTLLRFLLSLPDLLLSSLYNSLLLLFAWPWCFLTLCVSVTLACLHVALYLLHVALIFWAVAILTLIKHSTTDGGTKRELYRQKKLERCHFITRLQMKLQRRCQ